MTPLEPVIYTISKEIFLPSRKTVLSKKQKALFVKMNFEVKDEY